MVVQKSSIQTYYYVTTLDLKSFFFFFYKEYIYIYHHHHHHHQINCATYQLQVHFWANYNLLTRGLAEI